MSAPDVAAWARRAVALLLARCFRMAIAALERDAEALRRRLK